MFFLMGSFIVYSIMTKWLWDPHVRKLVKNIMGMGMHKIIEQMWKVNPQNEMKIVIFENWLTSN
jgi:hypothetical protein